MLKRILLPTLVIAISVQAATYTPLSVALKQLLPVGQKAYKTTFVTTEAQATVLNGFGHGDFLAGDKIEVYYTKDEKNAISGVAVDLLEVLVRWKSCHTWVVGLTPDGKLTGVAIRELSDKYAFPLTGEGFLKQFPGKKPDQMVVGKGMDAVAGASESCALLSASLKRAAYIAAQANIK